MYRDDLYIGYEQQKSIEDVIAYLIENKPKKLLTPILDLMRMSENWYGRLEEMRSQHPAPSLNQPTPCPDCDEFVELNDMNNCNMCDQLKCKMCCANNYDDCNECQANYTCEYIPERGKNADIECGKYAPNKIHDIRCCNRHYRSVEKSLGL